MDHKLPYLVKDAGHGIGKGLFAAEDIPSGTYIVEYTGAHIPTSYADEQSENRYLFELDEHWTIDGSGEENEARYANHSCDPNAESVIEDGRVYLVATRDIRSGEEITFDYGEEYVDDFIAPHGCRCATCRQRLAVSAQHAEN